MRPVRADLITLAAGWSCPVAFVAVAWRCVRGGAAGPPAGGAETAPPAAGAEPAPLVVFEEIADEPFAAPADARCAECAPDVRADALPDPCGGIEGKADRRAALRAEARAAVGQSGRSAAETTRHLAVYAAALAAVAAETGVTPREIDAAASELRSADVAGWDADAPARAKLTELRRRHGLNVPAMQRAGDETQWPEFDLIAADYNSEVYGYAECYAEDRGAADLWERLLDGAETPPAPKIDRLREAAAMAAPDAADFPFGANVDAAEVAAW